MDFAFRTLGGSLFHCDGAAHAKDLSPYVTVRDIGCSRDTTAEDLA